MGIRFYCYECKHKLNVKAFQAGRRGLCPYCGASIQIPARSTRPSSKQLRGPRADPGAFDAGGAPVPTPEPKAQAPTAAPLRNPASIGSRQPVLPLPQTQATGSPLDAPGDVVPTSGRIQPVGPGAAPESGPAPAQPRAQGPAQTAGQAPVAATSQPAALHSPIEPPVEAAPIQTAVPADRDPLPAASPAPAAPLQSSPASPQPADPLAEAPDAVWYVRPPSGGQFGPATSDLMRTWIAEGRVSPEALVWREGWRDWQQASETFVQLGGGEVLPGLGALGPIGTPSAKAGARGSAGHSRSRSTALNVAIITVLILAVIVLFAVLIWILGGGPW